jgi:hypothetical protein
VPAFGGAHTFTDKLPTYYSTLCSAVLLLASGSQSLGWLVHTTLAPYLAPLCHNCQQHPCLSNYIYLAKTPTAYSDYIEDSAKYAVKFTYPSPFTIMSRFPETNASWIPTIGTNIIVEEYPINPTTRALDPQLEQLHRQLLSEPQFDSHQL